MFEKMVVMRYEKTHKERTKHRIVSSASVELRKRGSGLSIPDLMKAAGLTHGGFYAHFDSRAHFLREALHFTMDQTNARLNSLFEHASDQDGVAAISAHYLSVLHRDNPGDGCALPIFAPEVAKQNKASRAAFAAKLEDMIAVVTRAYKSRPPEEARRLAVATISTLVGSLTLSRACAGAQLSDEILEAGRVAIAIGSCANTGKMNASRKPLTNSKRKL